MCNYESPTKRKKRNVETSDSELGTCACAKFTLGNSAGGVEEFSFIAFTSLSLADDFVIRYFIHRKTLPDILNY